MEGYQNIAAALKVPKNTVAFIILKWKKFGTTKTLPRAGHPAKLSNQARRALVREVTKNKIIWADEIKIESFGMNAKRHAWRKPGTIPTVKHGGNSIMPWECFSTAGTGRLVRMNGKMNGAKYRAILDKNLLQRA